MDSQTAEVLAKIDREELTRLALDLGNIDSPAGREKDVADFVANWLRREGFPTKVLGLTEDRPNVVGVCEGTGGGYSLLFNSHMDVAVSPDEVWTRRDSNEPIYRGAWQEGDTLYGEGIVNDKGPLACFLIAGKALKQAKARLKGDLLLTAVSGEISLEPVPDGTEAQHLYGRAVGAPWLVTHGIIADFALVAEASNFELAWVEAGEVFTKITVVGERSIYTPYLARPYPVERNPNAIVRMTKLIQRLEDWALDYEKKHTYICPGGTVIPRVAIGAIRGGTLSRLPRTSELCSIYVSIMTSPGQDVLALKAELEELLHSLELEGQVDIFVSRNGYEAKNIGPLIQAVEHSHFRLFNEKPRVGSGPLCSMWRDTNVFNEVGIPALTYGPAAASGGGNFRIGVDDLHKAASLYAMIALELCNQEKSRQ
ncbi:MAG: M20/M25/M40 family metallo-hydrolase [Chloroflexi bacterium]|nr:M20/M25/M40 family metallo-hydrolase [Chloroflexota bacterium]